jgi:hypothetical protein
MSFKIVRIDERSDARTVPAASFGTLKEATDHLKQEDAGLQGEHGYDAVRGFWWRRDSRGQVTRIYVDDDRNVE